MAHMNQERKTKLAALAKAALKKWPGVKWTLRVKKPGTLVFTVTESNIDFAADVIEGVPYGERASSYIRGAGHIDVNHYNLDRAWQGESLAFFTAARDALMTGNHNNSDVQTDYFDVGWYLSFQIGRWNKPCKFTFAPAAALVSELVERASEVAAEMFDGGPCYDSAAALPNEDVLAAMLAILANPESDQDQRDSVAERFERVGRSIETSSFRDAGVMTDDAGFIIRFGGLAEFQVTVVRSR